MSDFVCKCGNIFANKRNLERLANNCTSGSKKNKQVRFKCKLCGAFSPEKILWPDMLN